MSTACGSTASPGSARTSADGQAREARLALLEERGDALVHVVGAEGVLEAGDLERRRDVGRLPGRGDEHALRERDGRRRVDGDLGDRLARPGEQRVAVGEPARDEPGGDGLVDADPAPGVDELLRAGEADGPGEPHGAAEARDETQLHLGLAEVRGIRRVDEVACECELEAPTECEPVDAGDDGGRQRLDGGRRAVAATPQLGRFLGRERRDGPDVGAGDEGPAARADEQHAAQCRIRRRRARGTTCSSSASTEPDSAFSAAGRSIVTIGDPAVALDAHRPLVAPVRGCSIRHRHRSSPARRSAPDPRYGMAGAKPRPVDSDAKRMPRLPRIADPPSRPPPATRGARHVDPADHVPCRRSPSRSPASPPRSSPDASATPGTSSTRASRTRSRAPPAAT